MCDRPWLNRKISSRFAGIQVLQELETTVKQALQWLYDKIDRQIPEPAWLQYVAYWIFTALLIGFIAYLLQSLIGHLFRHLRRPRY